MRSWLRPSGPSKKLIDQNHSDPPKSPALMTFLTRGCLNTVGMVELRVMMMERKHKGVGLDRARVWGPRWKKRKKGASGFVGNWVFGMGQGWKAHEIELTFIVSPQAEHPQEQIITHAHSKHPHIVRPTISHLTRPFRPTRPHLRLTLRKPGRTHSKNQSHLPPLLRPRLIDKSLQVSYRKSRISRSGQRWGEGGRVDRWSSAAGFGG